MASSSAYSGEERGAVVKDFIPVSIHTSCNCEDIRFGIPFAIKYFVKLDDDF